MNVMATQAVYYNSDERNNESLVNMKNNINTQQNATHIKQIAGENSSDNKNRWAHLFLELKENRVQNDRKKINKQRKEDRVKKWPATKMGMTATLK